MDAIIDSAKQSILYENWLGALSTCLTLPDICGKLIEDPKVPTGQRYKNWVEKYLVPKYTSKMGPDNEEYVFLTAEDCYALRCAFVHEGAAIDEKNAKKASEIVFCLPTPGRIVHSNKVGNKLQLQVDIFCKDIIKSVEYFLKENISDSTFQSRMTNLMNIYNIKGLVIKSSDGSSLTL